MPAVNFTMFLDKIENGTKNQTIRGSAGWSVLRPGDKLHLWTGMRTKDARKLKEVVCKCVVPIAMTEHLVAYLRTNVIIKGSELELFAHEDGFSSYAEMWKFFEERSDEHGEYQGWIIKW